MSGDREHVVDVTAKTPGQVAYEARMTSFWRRHGGTAEHPVPPGYVWDDLTGDQQADEETGAESVLAATRQRNGIREGS